MKLEDISKVMDNLDAKHVMEAANSRPRSLNKIRFIALVACLAILVTSIPLALILNREDASEHKHIDTYEEHIKDHLKNPEDTVKGFGSLQLSNGTLDLNVIQLSNGKINKDTDTVEQDKYVYDYTPVNAADIFDEMINKAYPYYGLTEFEYEKRPSDAYFHGTYIENSRYSLISYDDIIEKRIYSADSTHSASTFVNQQLKNNGYEPGTVKFPEEDTSEKIFETFADHLAIINDLLVEDIDSCLVYPVISGKCTVYYWNSSNERLNQEAEEIRELTKDDKYKMGQISLSSTFRVRSIQVEYTMNKEGYVEKIDVKSFELPHRIDYEKYEEEILDYLALAIPKKYFCDATEESFWNCALSLEPFLKDVFSIDGFENEYDFEIRDPGKNDDFIGRSSYGVTKVGTLEVSITPTPEHTKDVVTFTFYSIDGKTFYLYDIETKCSIGGDNYIELITPESAIDHLLLGYGIGDLELGCYICREKYRHELLEFVEENVTYELVTLKGIEFETSEGTVKYDMPFYKFTSKSDAEGNYYISYVIAVNYGHNIRFDLSEVNSLIRETNFSMCPGYKQHRKIETEKVARTKVLKEEFIEEYLREHPDASRHDAVYQAESLFRW